MNDQTHEPFEGHAAVYVLGAFTETERAAFETHLAGCRVCADEVGLLGPVARGLAHAVPSHEAPEALRARVLTTVPPAPIVEPVESGDSGGPGFHPAWLAAAAALVLGAGLGWYGWQQRDLARSLEGELAAAADAAVAADAVAAAARRRDEILAAGDLVVFPLAGQPVAPDAVGRAFWSPSRGIVFTAAGLPPLPADRVYQLWFIPEQPVSAGLLAVDPSGIVIASLDAAPGIAAPVTMAVSIEPAGGVPAPTGDLYLVGQPSD